MSRAGPKVPQAVGRYHRPTTGRNDPRAAKTESQRDEQRVPQDRQRLGPSNSSGVLEEVPRPVSSVTQLCQA
ncbi:hypothetical protein C9J85_08535 [Haloferax sp. wsp5]|nr:hypothetical protein C9J85_08535 [Haloferax sp. wsp5]